MTIRKVETKMDYGRGGIRDFGIGRTPSYMTALRYSALLLITGMLLVDSMLGSGFNSPLISC